MSRRAVIVGAGPNGLCAAAYLARAGFAVTVVEAAPSVGGLCRGREFHDGFVSPGLLADDSRVRPAVLGELELEKYGLSLRSAAPRVVVVGAESRLCLGGTVDDEVEAITRLSPRDGERYLEFRAAIDGFAPALVDFVDKAPLEVLSIENERRWDLAVRGWRMFKLGRPRLLELARIAPTPARDWLDEFFELGVLGAGIVLPALESTWLAPRSPSSSANLLFHECTRGPGVAGGAPALVRALDKAARALGAELRTDSEVASIDVDDGRASAVRLRSGDVIPADVIVSTADPGTTLLSLLHPRELPARVEHNAQNFRQRGTAAVMSVAVRGDVEFEGGPSTCRRARVAGGLDDIERAFDPIKYGECPSHPVVSVWNASADGAAVAAAGNTTLSVSISYVPYAEDGLPAPARAALERSALAALERAVPGVGQRVIATELLCPRDIEREYRTRGGHLHHGEMALDQIVVRPIPSAAGYRTHIAGLYLGGSGTHPGGGLSCASGRLAAAAVVADAG